MRTFFFLLLCALTSHAAVVHRGGGDFNSGKNNTLIQAYLNNTGAVTIAMWMKYISTDSGGTQEVIAKGRTDFGKQSLFDIHSTSDSLKFTYASPDTVFFTWTTTATQVQNSTWMHFAVTFVYGGTLTMYLNGAPVAGSWNVLPSLIPGLTNSLAFHIAANGSPGNFWNGASSEVAVWNVALTAVEVANLASGIHGMPQQIEPANLQAYWPMDDWAEGLASVPLNTLRDRGPNAVDLDLGGVMQSERVCSYPPNE